MPCCQGSEGGEGVCCEGHPLAKKLKSLSQKTRLLFGVALGVAVVLIGVIVTVIVYMRPVGDELAGKIVRVIPYPAAIVGQDTVSLKDLYEEYRAMQTYFASLETPPELSDDEIVVMITQTLTRKVAVRTLMERYGLTVDTQAVEDMYANMQEQAGGEEALTQKISETFGWRPEEFQARVVTPLVMADQLTKYVSDNEEIHTSRREEAQTVKRRVEGGEVFLDVAKEIMTAYEMTTDGDYEEIALKDLPEDWQNALEGVGDGGMTEVLKGAGVYLVLFVEKRIPAIETQSGEESVDLQFVAVPLITLEELVQDYLDSVWVWKLVGEETKEEEAEEPVAETQEESTEQTAETSSESETE